MSGTASDSRACPGELKPGDRVHRWRVVERLGTGSYGVVYRVEDGDAPGQSYALKLALRPSDVRAEREVALLARLEHPHVVRVHDWGRLDGAAGSHLYFVMDWVQGLPLHLWAEQANPPLRELVRVASALALTLDWLHTRGVRHLDLKPEHILIREEDAEPVLIDFGVGRQEGASTLISTVVPPGTLTLRSPEAVDFHRLHSGDEGARYTFQPTDDLYALGVCLYRALAGHHPFPPDLPGDLLMLAILAHVPMPLRYINPRVPAGFSDVVSRLLEKQPRARHRSGRELHQALVAARMHGSGEAWEERVFAWEAGAEWADPSERRTVRPVWPETPGTPAPGTAGSSVGRATGGRRAVGVMLLPLSALADPAALGFGLVRVEPREPPRERAVVVVLRHVLRAAMALGVVVLVGLVAWLATCRGVPSRAVEAMSQQWPLKEAVSPWVESPPGVDVAPMNCD